MHEPRSFWSLSQDRLSLTSSTHWHSAALLNANMNYEQQAVYRIELGSCINLKAESRDQMALFSRANVSLLPCQTTVAHTVSRHSSSSILGRTEGLLCLMA